MSTQSIDRDKLNPLVVESGDTTLVSSVLGFLSVILSDATADVVLSPEDAFGLSLIIDTCNSALRTMNQADKSDAS